jgi:UDP-N-acetylglucosamine 2-epimerase (non-hydrolysing)
MRVLSIIGTRPEAIKMAPVIREMQRRPATFESRVCVTGQHREMVDQILEAWRIVPDHDLAIMRPGQTLSHVASAVIDRMGRVLHEEDPDWVLVQGDTTTAMAATLAAFHNGIPVGHVEAGLRTYDMSRPFPEEANRRIIGLLASMHFAPTRDAARNLLREGTPAHKVRVTGNTVIDAFQHIASLELDMTGTPLETMCDGGSLSRRRIVLVTCHRRENFGTGLVDICEAIGELARERPDLLFVLPVHPNPQVSGVVRELLAAVTNVALLPPLDYQPMVWLLRHCIFLITDSGGLQEEATAVGRPVLVLRESTERPEGVEAGTAQLVGSDRQRILKHCRLLLDEPTVYEHMSRRTFPYGDGTAAARIVENLLAARRTPDVVMLDNHAYEGAPVPSVSELAQLDLLQPTASPRDKVSSDDRRA